MNIPLSPYAPDNYLFSRDGGSSAPSRVSLLILRTQAESGAYATGPVPSLLTMVRRHRASSPQRGSSNNACFHFAGHHAWTQIMRVCVCVCVCVCVFFPCILDVKFVGCASRGHPGGTSHRISHPPALCGACLYFSREKDSAVPFPRRP